MNSGSKSGILLLAVVWAAFSGLLHGNNPPDSPDGVTKAETLSMEPWISEEYPVDRRWGGFWTPDTGEGMVSFLSLGANHCLLQMEGRIHPAFCLEVDGRSLWVVLRQSHGDGSFGVDVYSVILDANERELLLSRLNPELIKGPVTGLASLAEGLSGVWEAEDIFTGTLHLRKI